VVLDQVMDLVVVILVVEDPVVADLEATILVAEESAADPATV